MKSIKRIFAIVFVMSLICTGAMTQYVFGSDNASAGGNEADSSPYIYLHDPDVPYQYRSPHRYSYIESNEEHNYYAPAIYRLLSGTDDSVLSLGYCCDLQTAAQPDGNVRYYYRRVNLEDAGYYSTENAGQIRRVLSEGFWVEPEDAQTNAPEINLSELIENVEDYKDGKIDIDGLTNAEAMSATQAAIWHYSNANDEVTDFVPYTRTLHAAMGNNADAVKDTRTVDASGPTNMYNVVMYNDTQNRINAVYDYLTRENAEGEAPKTAIWDFEDKSYYVTAQKGADDISFNVTVKFKMTGDQEEKNDLDLTVTPVIKTDAEVESIAPFTENLSELDEENGIYTVEFTGINRDQVESLEKLEFVLDGTQEVEHDAYFYESQKDEKGDYLAQCFVGLASGTTVVHREWTLELSAAENSLELIKYDEDSIVTEDDPEKIAMLEEQGMIQVEEGQFVKYAFPVVGAKFDLYARIDDAEEGIKVDTATTGSDGKITWDILADADNISYYCEEVEAPAGYRLPDGTITFDLSSDEARKYISNCHDTGSITISKAVKGMNTTQHFNFEIQVNFSKAAAYARLNDEEKTIRAEETEWQTPGSCKNETLHEISWTTVDEENDIRIGKFKLAAGETLTINNLPVGAECTVTELDEEGNAVSDDEAFVYGEAFYVTKDAVQIQEVSVLAPEPAGSDDKTGNNTINFVNEERGSRIHFRVNKADLTTGEEIAGSEISIYDKETGEMVAAWISDGNGSYDFGQYLTAGREYILRETIAPDGYTYIQDTEFKVNRDGTIRTDLNTAPAKSGARAAADEAPVYLVEDDITRVSIAKVDADGNVVTGAKLAVKDAQTGDTVVEWTSQSSAKEINGVLTAGKTYILTEIEAPEGYQKAEDMEFTVPQQPEKIEIEMVDQKTGGAGGVSTGDRTRMGLCLILMTASMLLATGAVCFRRKNAR